VTFGEAMFNDWSRRFPLDRDFRAYGSNRWLYFRSLLNAPTLTGILQGVFLEPWMQKLLGLSHA